MFKNATDAASGSCGRLTPIEERRTDAQPGVNPDVVTRRPGSTDFNFDSLTAVLRHIESQRASGRPVEIVLLDYSGSRADVLAAISAAKATGQPTLLGFGANAEFAEAVAALKAAGAATPDTPASLLREVAEHFSMSAGVNASKFGNYPNGALPLSYEEGHLWRRICDLNATASAKGIRVFVGGKDTPEKLLVELAAHLAQSAEDNGSSGTDKPVGRLMLPNAKPNHLWNRMLACLDAPAAKPYDPKVTEGIIATNMAFDKLALDSCARLLLTLRTEKPGDTAHHLQVLENSNTAGRIIEYLRKYPTFVDEIGTREKPLFFPSLSIGDASVATYIRSLERTEPVSHTFNGATYEIDATLGTVRLVKPSDYAPPQTDDVVAAIGGRVVA